MSDNRRGQNLQSLADGPKRPFASAASKVWFEPILANAARCPNDRNAGASSLWKNRLQTQCVRIERVMNPRQLQRLMTFASRVALEA